MRKRVSTALEAWAAPGGGPDPWIALRAPPKARHLYLHLYLRMRVHYVLWCHLSDSTHTGVLSEGECEYKVPNTYRNMDMHEYR